MTEQGIRCRPVFFNAFGSLQIIPEGCIGVKSDSHEYFHFKRCRSLVSLSLNSLNHMHNCPQPLQKALLDVRKPHNNMGYKPY